MFCRGICINVDFQLGNVIEIKEIFTVFEQAANHMIAMGIYQWDSVYPNIDVIKNDLHNNDLYVGKINHEIAVVFVLNNVYDKQYDNGNWMHNSEPFEVIRRLCVHPKFQNKGIGRIAMEYIENRLISTGINSVGYFHVKSVCAKIICFVGISYYWRSKLAERQILSNGKDIACIMSIICRWSCRKLVAIIGQVIGLDNNYITLSHGTDMPPMAS